VRNLAPEDMLETPTIAEQFRYIYPLEFELRQREQAFFDPGRIRNHGFFSSLYFAEEASSRRSLVSVRDAGLGNASFQVTSRNNVSCQLAAAIAALAELDQDFSPFFRGVGGGFAWRKVSGTDRLSPHSFGIAIDLNPKLGGYWLWSGARPGKVGRYNNRIPEAIVRTMESFGFIWGGKWHHYDGMHFEYRPEVILHARMMKP
jgi:D-alanyl-D-alanine carboxypeptidase